MTIGGGGGVAFMHVRIYKNLLSNSQARKVWKHPGVGVKFFLYLDPWGLRGWPQLRLNIYIRIYIEKSVNIFSEIQTDFQFA